MMGVDPEDGSTTASTTYTTEYGAPSTPEEKQHFKIWKDAYIKGYRDGVKAK